MHNFKDLKVWQKARALVKESYLLTKGFPVEERYELISHIRRTVVSIPPNIAEGSGKDSNKEFRRFLNIALSSAFELETQMNLASDLGYMNDSDFEEMIGKIQEVQKMIFGFRKSLTIMNK